MPATRQALLTSTAAPSAPKSQPERPALTDWRERAHVTVQLGSEVSGLSPTSLYRARDDGLLTFLRLRGRVLIETKGLIALIGSAEPWTPSDRGKAARQRRSEIARSVWR